MKAISSDVFPAVQTFYSTATQWCTVLRHYVHSFKQSHNVVETEPFVSVLKCSMCKI